MNPDMGISQDMLRITHEWEVQRLYGTIEEYQSAKKLAERIIELEDLMGVRESQNEGLREEIKSSKKDRILLSAQVQGMITQIEHYNKRLIKVRIRSFINSIFSKLGYVREK